MTLPANSLKIDIETLKIVFEFTEESAKRFILLSDDDKIKEDFRILSERTDFVSKVAATVILNGFEKLSSKQADIINSKSIFIYEPIFTSGDHAKMEIHAEGARYRQASSSLR